MLRQKRAQISNIETNLGLEFCIPKLGVTSILWLNLNFTKTRVLRAGQTQSNILFDSLLVLALF